LYLSFAGLRVLRLKPYLSAMRILFANLLLVFFIVAIACNKDTHQEKAVLNYKEREVLFAKLASEPLFNDYRKATTELTMALGKTAKQGGKVDTVKLKDNNEKDFVKKLTNAGVVNAEELRDLSNRQVGLMKQLMAKYPEIRKVPISDWNAFFQSQSYSDMKKRMAPKQN
jgi:hypothetical protein